MRRTLAALLLTAAIVPTVATTSALAATHTVVIRVFDPYHRDYHRWDTREQRAYRAYLNERHHSYIAYRNQRLTERRAYWHWRHEREERLERR